VTPVIGVDLACAGWRDVGIALLARARHCRAAPFWLP
jgi:hypothetical protein